MNYRCGKHQWAAAQQPCPDCALEMQRLLSEKNHAGARQEQRPPVTLQGGYIERLESQLAAAERERDRLRAALEEIASLCDMGTKCKLHWCIVARKALTDAGRGREE